MSEGYVDNTINSFGANVFNYVYQYKDYLGNVRMNFAYRPPAVALPGLTVIKDESHLPIWASPHEL